MSYSKIFKNLILSSLFCLSSTYAEDVYDHNYNAWINYFGDHPLGDSKWGIHYDMQARRADYGENWQQRLYRPGINYQLNSAWSLSAGYAYVETSPFGDYPAKHTFPEHRIWEQVQWMGKTGESILQMRLRLEQRYIGEVSRHANDDWQIDRYRYENRVRLMLRLNVPITQDKKWQGIIWNELFINYGENVVKNYFDQNRFFMGVSYQCSKYYKIELGLMEQTLQKRGGVVWENNHTLWLSLVSKLPIDF
jgi:hypothetical protein